VPADHSAGIRTLLHDEILFGDGEPDLGPVMTSAKVALRSRAVVDVLEKAATKAKSSGDHRRGRQLANLADDLRHCRPRSRCVSLACPQCLRALQRAKTEVFTQAAQARTATRSKARPVFVTIAPPQWVFEPSDLNKISLGKVVRWLKDTLRREGVDRPMLGSLDINVNNEGRIRIHLHAVMWTKNSARLTARLKKALSTSPDLKYARSVQVNGTRDLGFIAYSLKLVKFQELLRHNRKILPDLLLFLDRTKASDILVLFGFHASAQRSGFIVRPLMKASG